MPQALEHHSPGESPGYGTVVELIRRRRAGARTREVDSNYLSAQASTEAAPQPEGAHERSDLVRRLLEDSKDTPNTVLEEPPPLPWYPYYWLLLTAVCGSLILNFFVTWEILLSKENDASILATVWGIATAASTITVLWIERRKVPQLASVGLMLGCAEILGVLVALFANQR